MQKLANGCFRSQDQVRKSYIKGVPHRGLNGFQKQFLKSVTAVCCGLVVQFCGKNWPRALEGILPEVSKSCSDSGKQQLIFSIGLTFLSHRHNNKDPVYVLFARYWCNVCRSNQKWWQAWLVLIIWKLKLVLVKSFGSSRNLIVGGVRPS